MLFRAVGGRQPRSVRPYNYRIRDIIRFLPPSERRGSEQGGSVLFYGRTQRGSAGKPVVAIVVSTTDSPRANYNPTIRRGYGLPLAE
jgi:hypothetical protein